MTLTDICTSLTISKSIKDLGFERESLFYYFKNKTNGKVFIAQNYEIMHPEECKKICSTYTVGELGEILPFENSTHRLFNEKEFWCVEDLNEDCEECGEKIVNIIKETRSDTEANARGLMLIHLLEQEIIEGEG